MVFMSLGANVYVSQYISANRLLHTGTYHSSSFVSGPWRVVSKVLTHEVTKYICRMLMLLADVEVEVLLKRALS